MNPIEVYVMCESRSAELARHFLDVCLPSRTPVADQYPFPEYVDTPTETFQSPEKLMEKLADENNESYSIYWDAVDNCGPQQAMIFYTDDGAMIAGLGGPNLSIDESLTLISHQVNGRFGYVTSGSCPPETIEEFLELCHSSTLPSLVDGCVRNPSA